MSKSIAGKSDLLNILCFIPARSSEYSATGISELGSVVYFINVWFAVTSTALQPEIQPKEFLPEHFLRTYQIPGFALSVG